MEIFFPRKKIIYSFLEVNENTKIMHGLYTCKVLKIGIYDSLVGCIFMIV